MKVRVDLEDKVLEDTDLEVRGHVPAISASKHQCWEGLIFPWQPPAHVSIGLKYSPFGRRFHDCTRGNCSLGGLLCCEALEVIPESST